MGRLVMALAAMALVLVISVPPTAHAAISFVADLGGKEVAGGGDPGIVSITTTAVAPVGASIIILGAGRGDTLPTGALCSDSASNFYGTDLSQSLSPNPMTAAFLSAICSTHIIGAALPTGSTLTMTWSGGGVPFSGRARAFAVTGLSKFPLDRTATAVGTSTSPSSGAAAPTTQADELLVGLITDLSANVGAAGFSPGTNGTANNCATTGTPTFSALPGVGSTTPSVFAMYCIVAATGAYQARATTSSDWQALLTAYRALLAPPTLSKAFGAASITTNATTTLTFTLTNSNPGSPLTVVGFTDPVPAGLVISTPNGLTGSCGGGTISAIAGTNTIALTGATLAGGSSCTFAVNVTGVTPGSQFNVTSTVSAAETGNGNPATATITVVAPSIPTLSQFGQVLVVMIVVLTGLLFLKRRLSLGR